MLVSRAGSRNPNPFGDSASFQPHRLPFPRAFAPPCWETPELPLGWPPGKQELGGALGSPGYSWELSLELLSLCPFRQQPWHIPSSHRVGQPALFPLSRALLSCSLTRALLESTAAKREVQSSPISSTPKNTLPAVVLAPSHPRAGCRTAQRPGNCRMQVGWGELGGSAAAQEPSLAGLVTQKD